MTKITSTRVFEKGQISNSEAAKDLNPFIDWVINNFENIVRVLLKGVGIVDNMDAEIKTVTMTHNVPLTIAVSKKPLAIYVGRQVPTTNPLTSFTWEFASDREITLKSLFLNSPTDKIDVYLTIHYS